MVSGKQLWDRIFFPGWIRAFFTMASGLGSSISLQWRYRRMPKVRNRRLGLLVCSPSSVWTEVPFRCLPKDENRVATIQALTISLPCFSGGTCKQRKPQLSREILSLIITKALSSPIRTSTIVLFLVLQPGHTIFRLSPRGRHGLMRVIEQRRASLFIAAVHLQSNGGFGVDL